MAELEIRLLGPLQVSVAGQPVLNFKSNKARALLVYLAVEAGKLHHRAVLAGTFWPDLPEQSALSNLRDNISFLRKIVGDRADNSASPLTTSERAGRTPFLQITRDTIQFNPRSDFFIDAVQFLKMVKGEQPLEVLEEALELVQGQFLEGLTLKDGSGFEDWLLYRREQFNHQVFYTLRSVANALEERRQYDKAIEIAHRQLEYMPWSEETHRQLIRLHALSGNQRQALIQYEMCKRALLEEMSVTPETATTRLYEQVRDGKLYGGNDTTAQANHRWAHSASKPLILPTSSTPEWIHREHELGVLRTHYETAMTGEGRIIFVSGGSGTGKTTLAHRFCTFAMQANPDLLVVQGTSFGNSSESHTCMPIREIVQMLCDDSRNRNMCDAISEEQIRRLDAFAPTAREIFAQKAPLLTSRFLPPNRETASTRDLFAPAAVRGEKEGPQFEGETSFESSALTLGGMVNEFARALTYLAGQQPLVMIFDDFQWADPPTIQFLNYLGRRLAGSQILILCLYRPGDGHIPHGESRQPLHSFINELRVKFGEICLDLDQVDGAQFVDALLGLDAEPYHPEFRSVFYNWTGDNPLLSIDLLHDLKRRGVLQPAPDGIWSAVQPLTWERLPARVDAMLAERFAHIDASHRRLLSVACVQGEVFFPAVVAAVLNLNNEDVVQAFSGPLSKEHRVVTAAGIEQVENTLFACYRFHPGIFQQFLYYRLEMVERRYLHAYTGTAMKNLFGSHALVAEHIAQGIAQHEMLSGFSIAQA